MLNVIIVIATFIGMEFVAWFTHKFVMHGFLWILHRDHHTKESLPSWLERNDAFFLIFAIPSILLLFFGATTGSMYAWPIGLGILFYGLAYFFVHDIFIHQRVKWLRKTDNIYFRALRRAHKVHHKHIGKEEGECFGMLMVPLKYFKEEIKAVR